ncbi:ATP-binding cassette subfamily G member 4 [Microplitis demolitor]|uniref:ATP-binding cassette subfamily G member 4 n=1 Tax=Microplitis demolitor TaxID=69319 RepID=UPI0004CDC87B|nr:ATP-binding cassette subfamily G member 4 [Microplitis demolitor]XP_014300224.1 ATP-binding cassette subfamily G member 4 [Microplitis demolitor]
MKLEGNSSRDDDANGILMQPRKGSVVRVQIVPIQPKTITHLPKRPPVDLAFTDLTYKVREGRKGNEKTILKSVSGRLRSGELTAIMGPSGAGKSTLLNILTGYKSSGMEGSITMNGNERNLSTFRKLSAYIMQDNQLHGNLTVEEAMKVAASLKLSSKIDKAEKEELIQEILETLGLAEHRRTMTSNLSGGQKKRLSIALELVNNPPIMFFDEPTSGLDSSSCFQCISLLKTLARGGRTIICTIHQPSARLFEMFDALYTLAEGQCVYQGSTSQLVPFLRYQGLNCPSYHNPASFIIEVACGEYGDNISTMVNAIKNGKHDIRDGYPFPDSKSDNLNNAHQGVNGLTKDEKSPGLHEVIPITDKNDASNIKEKYPEKTESLNLKDNHPNGGVIPTYATNDISKHELVITVDEKKDNIDVNTSLLDETMVHTPKRYPTSELTQFWIVLKRTLLFSRRDWTLMYLRLFAHILVGLLIGALYYDIGNDGGKVLSNLGFLFFNMLFLMYTSMTITILSFPLEMPVLMKENFNRWYSLKSYYLAITISDLPFQTIFCMMYLCIVYFLTSQPLDAMRFSMFVGACLLISYVAQSVGLVVGAAMNVQNGVFLAPVMSVPFLLFSGFFVSFDAIPVYLRWITYLSYIRYGFEGTALATYGFSRSKLKCFQPYCHFKEPTTTLEELDMLDADFTLDILALILIFLVLRIAAYLFLRWKLKAAR